MKLESFQIEHKTTGEKKNIFGEKPNGYLIFTPQKRMMALLTAEGRKQPNTDEDRIAAFWSMGAYSGIYRVEGDKWTTKVDVAWTETWTGSDQIRFFKLEGDKLSMDLGTRRLPEGGDYVFRGADGHQPPQKADRWFPRAVTKACHRLTEAGRQADVQMPKGFTWHCLRHTIASRLAMAGVDLLVIKELGGWKTLAMVTRYAHLSPGRLREGIERLTVAADSQSGPLPAASTMGSLPAHLMGIGPVAGESAALSVQNRRSNIVGIVSLDVVSRTTPGMFSDRERGARIPSTSPLRSRATSPEPPLASRPAFPRDPYAGGERRPGRPAPPRSPRGRWQRRRTEPAVGSGRCPRRPPSASLQLQMQIGHAGDVAPGRAKLRMSPSPTGSPPRANTIGICLVAAWAAFAAFGSEAKIMSTPCWTRHARPRSDRRRSLA